MRVSAFIESTDMKSRSKHLSSFFPSFITLTLTQFRLISLACVIPFLAMVQPGPLYAFIAHLHIGSNHIMLQSGFVIHFIRFRYFPSFNRSMRHEFACASYIHLPYCRSVWPNCHKTSISRIFLHTSYHFLILDMYCLRVLSIITCLVGTFFLYVSYIPVLLLLCLNYFTFHFIIIHSRIADLP